MMEGTLGEMLTIDLQTMSNIPGVQEELIVGRGDPAYMAHGYLTKVPVPAIRPFIEAYTKPGDIVLDPFAGSGMTGVAAAMAGRRGRLFDISVLGQHIGRNYVNLVSADLLRKLATEVSEGAARLVSDVYRTPCQRCGDPAAVAKTVWSFLVQCSGCHQSVNYFKSMEQAGFNKSEIVCPHCGERVSAKDPRVGEEPVQEYVNCPCSPSQILQTPSLSDTSLVEVLKSLRPPDVEISSDRQMYKASALGKHGMTTVASFYSDRNLAVLTALRNEIAQVTDDRLQSKLLFAFTACLTRASKRYQWSFKRPLNAANANYYVAMVFYEWNVYDLFLRKVEALIRSDDWIRGSREGQMALAPDVEPDVEYELSSATSIPLPDNSVDYVFTDPPFGSNLFYADMALFQEAWLEGFTDPSVEAVIDRGTKKNRTAARYEDMLASALTECRRVLKPGGRISMVFGNSSGSVWSLVQRCVRKANLVIEPESLIVLNKGQRSVKGLASGFENVATLDLILTMRPNDDEHDVLLSPTPALLEELARSLIRADRPQTPSHLYLETLRTGIRNGWDLGQLDLGLMTNTLLSAGLSVDGKTARVCNGEVANK
jgi:16S rRNA G966 N2-methylase RsmD